MQALLNLYSALYCESDGILLIINPPPRGITTTLKAMLKSAPNPPAKTLVLSESLTPKQASKLTKHFEVGLQDPHKVKRGFWNQQVRLALVYLRPHYDLGKMMSRWSKDAPYAACWLLIGDISPWQQLAIDKLALQGWEVHKDNHKITALIKVDA